MPFVLHTWEDHGRGPSLWEFFLGLKGGNLDRWRVAYTSAVGSVDEQAREEEVFIDWCTDQVIAAKLVRYVLWRYSRPYNKVGQYKLDRSIEAMGSRKRVIDHQERILVLSWHEAGTERGAVRSAIAEDLEDHRQTRSLFLDATGGRMLQDHLERYLLPARSQHAIDLDMLVQDGVRMAIMCGEYDAGDDRYFFTTIH